MGAGSHGVLRASVVSVPRGWLALALVATVPGCVAPTWYATDIFASSCDESVVLVVNMIGEQGKRFAVYRSAPRDLSRWEMVGHYAGRVRAAAVRRGVVWTFFEDGLYRLYPISSDTRLPKGGGATEEAPSGITEGEPTGSRRLGFDWTPRFACTDDKDGLWLVGVSEGKIVSARRAGDGPPTWKTDFPAETVKGLREWSGPDGAAKGGERGARSPVEEGEPSAVRITLRAHAARDLYVFWCVGPAGGGRTRTIHGLRLQHSSIDPALPGAWWTPLPGLEMPDDCYVDDFCVAPVDGETGIVARCRVPWLGGWMRDRMLHSRLVLKEAEREPAPEKGRYRWTAPSPVPGTTEAFRFGQVAGMSWLRWGSGGLLMSSNTQRVRVLEYWPGGGAGPGPMQGRGGAAGGRGWRAYSPAGWFVMYLPEIQVLTLLASAVLLVVTGCVVFLKRLSRLRNGGTIGYGAAASHEAKLPGPSPAPLSARVFAAVIDVMLVGGLVVVLPGMYEPPPSPVVPGTGQLVRHFLMLAGLVAYGTAMEAAMGATLGKVALGLKVVRRSAGEEGGGALGFGRALVRNLFRLIDTGAVGLAVISMTEPRRRFGDMAAGTIVVVARERAAKDEGEK